MGNSDTIGPTTMNMSTEKNVVLDFHTHCLPGMDDGAEDVDMALRMLRTSQEQGVNTLIATPHFYLGREDMDEFLERRAACAVALREKMSPSDPRLLLGAEVLVREGISELDLRPLCIEGTDLLLLELPFMHSPAWLYDEIENISLGQRLTVVLAHLDRYVPWYTKSEMEHMADMPGLIIQLNAEAVLSRRCFRFLRKWIPGGYPLVLGSDMHNETTRPPLIKEARRCMSRSRVGRAWLSNVDETAAALFG